MLNFKNCTLAQLDKTFNMEQTDDSHTLQTWPDSKAEISDTEQQV